MSCYRDAEQTACKLDPLPLFCQVETSGHSAPRHHHRPDPQKEVIFDWAKCSFHQTKDIEKGPGVFYWIGGSFVHPGTFSVERSLSMQVTQLNKQHWWFIMVAADLCGAEPLPHQETVLNKCHSFINDISSVIHSVGPWTASLPLRCSLQISLPQPAFSLLFSSAVGFHARTGSCCTSKWCPAWWKL